MSLETERDWMRKCAKDKRFSPADRDLWRRLAEEIDEYLTRADDAEAAAVAEDVALWEDA